MRAKQMHDYAFDVKLWAAVHIEAESVEKAKAALLKILDAAEPTNGFIKGFNDASQGCRITEVSISNETDSDLDPYEIDGQEQQS